MKIRNIVLCVVVIGLIGVHAAHAGQSVKLTIEEKKGASGQVPLSADLPPTGSQTYNFNVDGQVRTAIIHMPAGFLQRMPVVFSFHDLNSNAAGQEQMTGFSTMTDTEAFIAVYPQAGPAGWDIQNENGGDLKFVHVILAQLMESFPVDENKIYASGFSDGAAMSWRLACNAPESFAGFALVAGNYPAACTTTVRRPVLMFHGTQDIVMPYNGAEKTLGPKKFAMDWATVPLCKLAEEGVLQYQEGKISGVEWSCPGGPPVTLYTTQGGGHEWPGSSGETDPEANVVASPVIWEFFKRLSR